MHLHDSTVLQMTCPVLQQDKFSFDKKMFSFSDKKSIPHQPTQGLNFYPTALFRQSRICYRFCKSKRGALILHCLFWYAPHLLLPHRSFRRRRFGYPEFGTLPFARHKKRLSFTKGKEPNLPPL